MRGKYDKWILSSSIEVQFIYEIVATPAQQERTINNNQFDSTLRCDMMQYEVL